MKKKYTTGALKNEIDYRDIPVSAFQPTTSLPEKFISDISMLPVMNQLGLGSCVGHAVGLYLQFLDYKETGLITKISPRYIYAMSKAVDNYDGQGTYPRVAADQILKNGVITEEVVPCNDSLSHKEYINVPLENGWLKIKGYAFVNPTLNDIKQAIINNGAVMASITVGDFSKPLVKPGTQGLHYVMIYGYSGDTLLFRNSWGEGWGDKGNGSLNFPDFQGQIFDVMVITDVPNKILDLYKGILYKRGSRGSGVSQLQRDLKQLGYFKYPLITGYFGSVTESAVIAFQKANKLTADGKVGAKTLQKIDELKKKPKSLIEAIIQVESGGNDNAIGDLKLKHKAYGPLQIRQPVCIDVNKKLGTNYKSTNCLGNRDLSIKIFNVYMTIYCNGFSDEWKARCWNGGPSGYKKKATEVYWSKVKKLLE